MSQINTLRYEFPIHELHFKWTTSRARDSYGYNICTLWVDGEKGGRCNGGGYDMKGTSFGIWIAKRFEDELVAMVTEDSLKYQEFYGLTFHDPKWDWKKAPMKNYTGFLGDQEPFDTTIEKLHEEGQVTALEEYQMFYSGSNKFPTERHIVPLIDGATGFSSMEEIIKFLGYELKWIDKGGKNDDWYEVYRRDPIQDVWHILLQAINNMARVEFLDTEPANGSAPEHLTRINDVNMVVTPSYVNSTHRVYAKLTIDKDFNWHFSDSQLAHDGITTYKQWWFKQQDPPVEPNQMVVGSHLLIAKDVWKLIIRAGMEISAVRESDGKVEFFPLKEGYQYWKDYQERILKRTL